MIGVTAKLNVKEGMEAEFEAVFMDLQDAVRANEPGCLMYQLCRDDDGDYYPMVSEWPPVESPREFCNPTNTQPSGSCVMTPVRSTSFLRSSSCL